MKNILVVLGTRPEAIKLAPIILELRKYLNSYNVIICNTEQQKQLSNQTLSFFNLRADINLDVMTENQTLGYLQSKILEKLSTVYSKNKIDATIVQGDTMTVLSATLISFYNKVPIFHVEAGLRSYNLFEPFPEEAVRQIATRITNLHFAPTTEAKKALIKENIDENKIFVTGNTVVDALFCLSQNVLESAKKNLLNKNIVLNDKIILMTVHRRENHGQRLDNILNAILVLANQHKDHQFVLPVHPNPNVKDKIYESLNMLENIILTEPLDYPDLVCLMKNAKLILTDSGGIQEEAPTFGVPVLVMRYETERKEGVLAGFAKLVGANESLIIKEANEILKKDKYMSKLDGSKNPYGDGTSSQKIISYIGGFFNV